MPEKLTHLTFGSQFNQQVKLPNIKYICIGYNNQNLIDNLPNSIIKLELGYYFNLKLNDLPTSIKIIKFNNESEYNEELNNLPNFVEEIELPKTYSKKMKKIPINLKTIKCSKNYKYIEDFKNYEVITY